MIIKRYSKVIFRFLPILITLLLVVLLLIYLSPQRFTGEAIAISKYNDNDTVSVLLFLTRQRHIFKPTQITGKITFDGTEYESMSSFGRGYDIYNSNSFWKNLQLKFQKFSYDLFVRSDLRGQQSNLFFDTIVIEILTDNEILIYKSDNSRPETIPYTIALTPNK